MPVINSNNQQQQNQNPTQAQTNQAQDQGPAPKRTGTGFTNIQRILGSSDRNRVSQAIGSGLQGQVNRVQQGIQSAQQKFQTGVAQGRLDTDANRQYVNQTLQQAANDPSKITGDSDQAKEVQSRFATFRQGQYAGPTELAEAGALGAQAQNTNQLGSLARTGSGRNALLTRFFGNTPGYGTGQKRLDAMLFSPQNQNFRQAKQQAIGLSDQVKQASLLSNAQAQQAKEANQQFSRDVLAQIAGQRTGIEGSGDLMKSQVGDLQGKSVDANYIWGHGSEDRPLEIRTANRTVYDPTTTNIADLQSQMSGITGNTLTDKYNRALIQEDINKANYNELQRYLSGGVTKGEVGTLDPTLQSDAKDLVYNPLMGGQLAVNKLLSSGLISQEDYDKLSPAMTNTWAGIYGQVPLAKSYVGRDILETANQDVWGRGGKYARALIQATKDNPYLLPDAPRLLAAQAEAGAIGKNLDYSTAQNLSLQGLASDQEKNQLNALSALAGQDAKYNLADKNAYVQGAFKFKSLDNLLSGINQAKSQYLAQSDNIPTTI